MKALGPRLGREGALARYRSGACAQRQTGNRFTRQDGAARRGAGIRRWALSITHTKEHGLAFVIAAG